jgi:hypothetical protein
MPEITAFGLATLSERNGVVGFKETEYVPEHARVFEKEVVVYELPK